MSTAVELRNGYDNGLGLLSIDRQRMMGEDAFHKIFQQIIDWRSNINSHIRGSDSAISFFQMVELLADEISEAGDAFEKIVVFSNTLQIKKSIGLFLPEDIIGYNELIKKFENEMADVIVFWVSLVEKYHEEFTPRLGIDVTGSVLSSNGQSMGRQIFLELKNISMNIDKGNISNQLQHFLKMFLSYIDHLSLPIDIPTAVQRKLIDNEANRTFGEHSLVDGDGNPLPIEVKKFRYDFDNILSKRLRSLFSELLGYEVNPILDWMKEPFSDLFDYRMFMNLGDLEVEIYKHFIDFFSGREMGDEARQVVVNVIENLIRKGEVDSKVISYLNENFVYA